MTFRKWTALALAMLAALSLLACSAPDAEEAETPSVTLTADMLKKYTIVRSDLADYPLTRCAMDVREAAEAAGCKMTLTTDFWREGISSFQILDTEVLVGETNRPETAEFLDSLAPWQWGYALVGTKIVIAGHDLEGTRAAVDAFIERIIGREPFRFSDTDRFVYGDVLEGTGPVTGILALDTEETGDALAGTVKNALEKHPDTAIIVLRSLYREDEDGAAEIPEGYAAGADENDGEHRTRILFRTESYTFSSGDAIELLNYPNLTPAERGSLVYTVLRSRETGDKAVYASAVLPPDASAGTRLRVVEGFLGHTGSMPAVIVGMGLGLDGKNVTTEADFMRFGYAAAIRLATEKDGEENPSVSLFLPYEDLTADAVSNGEDGSLWIGVQRTKR